MIRLSNGHSFNFMVASGALAYDGRGWPWEWPLRWVGLLDPSLFTIVTKTLTRQPRRGNLRWYNPLRVIRPLTSPPSPLSLIKERGRKGERSFFTGVVNAVGLTNPGIEWWCQKAAPRLARLPYKMIVSLEAENPAEVVEMIRMLPDPAPLVGVELNLSCPNNYGEEKRTVEKTVRIVQEAKKTCRLPLLIKLGVTHDYLEIARQVKGLAEAVAINSVPWRVIFQDLPSPLEPFGGGGVSGKVVQPWTWKMARELAEAGSLPVIGPSIWDYGDIAKLFALGAQAVSFGSIFLWHPWRPTLYVRKWLRASDITKASSSLSR